MAGTAGSGGRNAVSPQAHVLKGTFRGDRHGDHETPEPPKGVPEPPKELEGDALDEWNRMVARLEKSGTLSVVDDAAIYQYAKLFAETEDIAQTRAETAAAARILQENLDGLEEVSFADILAAAQEIAKLRKLEANYISQVRSGRMAIRQYLVEFGQTPAARTRVKVPPKKPQSKVEQFRSQKQGV